MKIIGKKLAVPALILCLPGSTVFAEGNTDSLNQEAEKILQEELGAFEITAHQREAAKENEAGYTVLDAGRGNPNWINTQSRYAFTRFMNFAIEECELDFHEGNMAGHAIEDGIGVLDEYYEEYEELTALDAAA